MAKLQSHCSAENSSLTIDKQSQKTSSSEIKPDGHEVVAENDASNTGSYTEYKLIRHNRES